METPTPQEAAAAIADAEAGRDALAEQVAVPRHFFVVLGTAVALQIGTTAVGIAAPYPWLVVAGLAAFLALVGSELLRFRRLNGVWIGGLLSRVVGGTATAASTSYAAAFAAATWAAFSGTWWLVGLCAVAGGTAYALSGVRWMRRYRSEPATHSRGESAAWLAVVAALAVAGLVLLLVGS